MITIRNISTKKEYTLTSDEWARYGKHQKAFIVVSEEKKEKIQKPQTGQKPEVKNKKDVKKD